MKKSTLRRLLNIVLFAGLLWILPNFSNAAYLSVTSNPLLS